MTEDIREDGAPRVYTDAEVEKLVDQEALEQFDPGEFVKQMRVFISDHPEVTERVIVYVNEKMKNQILAELTDDERAGIQLVGLAELISQPSE
jgi:hypothetical protein